MSTNNNTFAANLSPADAPADSRIRVGVIYGGRSSEHSISCVSAGTVIGHLDPQKYEVVPVGITRDGTWTVGESDPTKLVSNPEHMPEVTVTEEIRLSADPTRRGELTRRDGSVYATVDVVFPILHGAYGEDGTIQGLFELSGIPYVGPGVLASACGMDKVYTKTLAAAAGIPVAPQVFLDEGEDELSSAERERLGLPVFVKPSRAGSSIGISKVTRWEDLPAAIAEAKAHDVKVLVESEVVGAEVEVGVLQRPDGSLQASVPARLQGTDESDEGFYGYETKYVDNVVKAEIPADLPADVTAELQRLALATFRALDCKGLSRVDFFATKNGPVLNEINTMPGLTPISMYPQVFAHEGIAVGELFDILISQALATTQHIH